MPDREDQQPNEHAGDYANIRDILGDYIGKKLVEITQHDKDEWDAGLESYILLHFDDGSWVKFFINEAGFSNGCGSDDPDAVRAWRSHA